MHFTSLHRDDIYGFEIIQNGRFGQIKEDGIAIIFLNRSRQRYLITLDVHDLKKHV